MKISIIGGGNMGSAIALGIANGTQIDASNITVVDNDPAKASYIKSLNNNIKAVTNDYSSLSRDNIIVFAVKPWFIEELINSHKSAFNPKQIFISIAAGVSLKQLSTWLPPTSSIFRIIPNTAIAVSQSMTFIASHNTSEEQNILISSIFDELGSTMFIEEKLVPAVTSLSSCGIAFAFRYIRASIEGGVEMGIYPEKGKEILIQTLRGAIELLEANDSHPEEEIDKVTTPGGITIKGINEMEHAGFTSAVIRGLKASFIK